MLNPALSILVFRIGADVIRKNLLTQMAALKADGKSPLNFTDLCPYETTSKKKAARVFAALLGEINTCLFLILLLESVETVAHPRPPRTFSGREIPALPTSSYTQEYPLIHLYICRIYVVRR